MQDPCTTQPPIYSQLVGRTSHSKVHMACLTTCWYCKLMYWIVVACASNTCCERPSEANGRIISPNCQPGPQRVAAWSQRLLVHVAGRRCVPLRTEEWGGYGQHRLACCANTASDCECVRLTARTYNPQVPAPCAAARSSRPIAPTLLLQLPLVRMMRHQLPLWWREAPQGRAAPVVRLRDRAQGRRRGADLVTRLHQ